MTRPTPSAMPSLRAQLEDPGREAGLVAVPAGDAERVAGRDDARTRHLAGSTAFMSATSLKPPAPTFRTVVNPASSVFAALGTPRSASSGAPSRAGRSVQSPSISPVRWTWVSMKPGSRVTSPRSVTRAPAGRSAPTARIRPFSIVDHRRRRGSARWLTSSSRAARTDRHRLRARAVGTTWPPFITQLTRSSTPHVLRADCPAPRSGRPACRPRSTPRSVTPSRSAALSVAARIACERRHPVARRRSRTPSRSRRAEYTAASVPNATFTPARIARRWLVPRAGDHCSALARIGAGGCRAGSRRAGSAVGTR